MWIAGNKLNRGTKRDERVATSKQRAATLRRGTVFAVCGLMLISIVGEGFAQTSGFDPRTAKLKSALARPMPPDGLRITVVLREPKESFARAERPETAEGVRPV